MKLVVGLGNWGKKYRLTRHNLGFMVLDELIKQLAISDIKDLKTAKIYTDSAGNLLVYPKLLMNNSGIVVKDLMARYKLEPTSLLVVRDDIDLTFGKIRGPVNLTGAGGHRGVESVIQALASNLFYQIKFGFGRPAAGENVDEFVLAKIPTAQLWQVKLAVLEIVRRVRDWLQENENQGKS